jgi:hypothetical protein
MIKYNLNSADFATVKGKGIRNKEQGRVKNEE